MAEDKKEEAMDEAEEETAALNAAEDDKNEKDFADGQLDLNGPGAFDSSKVKFINPNGDVEVCIEKQPGDSGGRDSPDFCGLSKDELLKYADDPYWVRVRWVMFIGFWVAWLAMLVAAILIIILAPKCPPRPHQEWYEKSLGYQVNVRSFKDSDGDGIGDLKGVEEKLTYLKNNSVNAVWLSPTYASPMADLGYDIADFKAIAPSYGTMDDFESLRSALHRRGMKLVIDLVGTHSSANHTWFEKSRQSEDKYADYYVWQDGSGDSPPDDTLTWYGDPAWTKDAVRDQWYRHHNSPDMPDFNLSNEHVQQELVDILKFWLAKGVDGFRVRGVAQLEETPTVYGAVLAQWRHTLDAYRNETETDYKLLVVDVSGSLNGSLSALEQNGTKTANMMLNSALQAGLKQGCNSQCVAALVDTAVTSMPAGATNWLVGSGSSSRLASRMGDDKYMNAIEMLSLLLPGATLTYYGDEIAMVDGDLSFEQTVDPVAKLKGEADYAVYSRDPQNTPMQWSGEASAGFSSASHTWLPVNPDYVNINVQSEQAYGAGQSHLKVFRSLAALRSEPSFQWGRYEHGQMVDSNIFAFVRQARGFDGYLVALNFGPNNGVGNFLAAWPDIIPRSATIVANTGNFGDATRTHEFAVGTELRDFDNIRLHPGEGVVFKWAWDDVPNTK